jgi:nucleoside-diphosphate-sugar epimerase
MHGHRLAAPSENDESQRGVYFLTGDEHPTYAHLGHMIAAAFQRSDIRVVHLPAWLTLPLAHVSDVATLVHRRPSLFNADKMREATAGSWACSPDRAKAELGFQVAAPLEARLRDVAASYMKPA